MPDLHRLGLRFILTAAVAVVAIVLVLLGASPWVLSAPAFLLLVFLAS